jgi:hypothetical protein
LYSGIASRRPLENIRDKQVSASTAATAAAMGDGMGLQSLETLFLEHMRTAGGAGGTGRIATTSSTATHSHPYTHTHMRVDLLAAFCELCIDLTEQTAVRVLRAALMCDPDSLSDSRLVFGRLVTGTVRRGSGVFNAEAEGQSSSSSSSSSSAAAAASTTTTTPKKAKKKKAAQIKANAHPTTTTPRNCKAGGDGNETDTVTENQDIDIVLGIPLTPCLLTRSLLLSLLRRPSGMSQMLLAEALRQVPAHEAAILLRLVLHLLAPGTGPSHGLVSGASESHQASNAQGGVHVGEPTPRQTLRAIVWAEAMLDAHFTTGSLAMLFHQHAQNKALNSAPGATATTAATTTTTSNQQQRLYVPALTSALEIVRSAEEAIPDSAFVLGVLTHFQRSALQQQQRLQSNSSSYAGIQAQRRIMSSGAHVQVSSGGTYSLERLVL